MTDRERLYRYCLLREFHYMLLDVWDADNMNEWERSAFEALSSVLYLVEAVYAGQEE